ncbi:hypothetical protein SO802_023750 [Lithocarpus litseifolius]|uniref:Uncharacterized protein n=1 Tax=Lithocarpus litseifolius TaxID=425828 RepID=A0AAW2C7H8_9ROSI
MEENGEILKFLNKKRIKKQHEQKSLCSQRISELPDFHSMTHLQIPRILLEAAGWEWAINGVGRVGKPHRDTKREILDSSVLELSLKCHGCDLSEA